MERQRARQVLQQELRDDGMRPFTGINLAMQTSDGSYAHRASTTSPGELRLARLNAHARDSRIVFYEEEHYYVLDDSVRFPLSVSGVPYTTA